MDVPARPRAELLELPARPCPRASPRAAAARSRARERPCRCGRSTTASRSAPRPATRAPAGPARSSASTVASSARAGHLHRGRRDAGDAAEVGEQALEGEVPRRRAGSARPRRPRSSASRWPAATSRTSTMLTAAVDVGRDAAQEQPPDQPVRGPAGIVGAEDEARVDDDDRQALGGDAHRDGLGVVLGVDVGDAEPAGLERLGLVGRRRPARRGRPRRRWRCGRPGSPRRAAPPPSRCGCPPTLTSNTRSRSDVRIEVVPATWKTRSMPVHRGAHRIAVGDVAVGALELDPAQVRGVPLAADQQPQLVASRGELPDQMRAEEARPARDERRCHRRAW